jgi:type IV pilus assembly protein PilV
MSQLKKNASQCARLLQERGFSLIEVLVALLVLSIGLLGIAGLQSYSLRFNHQSYERTQATLMISNMAEKIMANPIAAKAGGYDGVAMGPAASYAGSCPANCANPGDLANYDIFRWKTTLQTPTTLAISQGDGSIVRIPDPSDADAIVFDITVQWTENNLTMSETIRVRTL